MIFDEERRSCRACGCTDNDCSQCIEAQGEPCFWVEPDLCSRCAREMEKKNTAANKNRMDVLQAARRLNISRSSVYRLIHAGELRSAAFGPVKGFQVWESSVEEYEQRRLEEMQVEEV